MYFYSLDHMELLFSNKNLKCIPSPPQVPLLSPIFTHLNKNHVQA
jgi:hypothetical protein